MAKVLCNDGTIEEAIVGESLVANCFSHGGIKEYESTGTNATNGDAVPHPANPKGLTSTQKWMAVIGLTAVCYFILYKAGSLK